MKIAIIGDGGWGTANALLLTGYGHEVSVWGASADHVADIARSRRNDRYLPGVELPPCIRWTADRATAVQDADMVVLATPSKYFGDVCASFAGLVPPDKLAVSLTKGFCEKTHARMSELARTALGVSRVAVLSGPSHAEEVIRNLPLAVVSASIDPKAAQLWQNLFNRDAFRVYTSSDVIGVETGAAVKNVVAVASGMLHSMEMGDNATAAMVTRGLSEIVRLGVALGGHAQTFSGLAGVGDLMVTAYSRHSRNFRLGEMLGEGKTLDEATKALGQVAEGIYTVKAIKKLSEKLNVEMPISNAVYEILYGGLSLKDAVRSLLERAPKPEQ